MIDTQIYDITNVNGDPRGVKFTLCTTIDSSPRKLFKEHRKLTSAFASLRVHLNSVRYYTGKEEFTVQHSMNETVKCACVCVFPKQEEILLLNPLAGIYGTKELGYIQGGSFKARRNPEESLHLMLSNTWLRAELSKQKRA